MNHMELLKILNTHFILKMDFLLIVNYRFFLYIDIILLNFKKNLKYIAMENLNIVKHAHNFIEFCKDDNRQQNTKENKNAKNNKK